MERPFVIWDHKRGLLPDIVSALKKNPEFLPYLKGLKHANLFTLVSTADAVSPVIRLLFSKAMIEAACQTSQEGDGNDFSALKLLESNDIFLQDFAGRFRCKDGMPTLVPHIVT